MNKRQRKKREKCISEWRKNYYAFRKSLDEMFDVELESTKQILGQILQKHVKELYESKNEVIIDDSVMPTITWYN